MKMFEFLLGFFLFLFPIATSAQIVMSEVMWMGSDVSTSDEWIELTNISDEAVNLSGWTIFYKNSSGQETPMLTIGEGTVIEPEQYFIISNYDAASSRLAIDPDIATTAVSLPNTNLLVKLVDQNGVPVDQIDDGDGAPFAGSNASGQPKASMERVDFLASGSDIANWQTATDSVNFDPGSLIFGTPGEANSQTNSSSSSSSSSSCSDPLQIAIEVQSGELTGVGSTTVNFQAIATNGTLGDLPCSFDFGDGESSSSCNPGPHKFDHPETFFVLLTVQNHCGITLSDSLTVQVDAEPGGEASVLYDGSHVIIPSALPNPEGADADHEWIELLNLEDHSVSLEGWKIVTGMTSKKSHKLVGSIPGNGRVKIYNSEVTFTLPNGETEVALTDPLGSVHSTLSWLEADDGRVYYPTDIRELDITETVQSVLDARSFVIPASPQVRHVTGQEMIVVRLLGVREIEGISESKSSIYLKTQDWLRALIEKKKIELQFDSEIWDSEGRLLSYGFSEGSVNIAEMGLSLGYFAHDPCDVCAFDERFKVIEEEAKREKRGLWKYVDSSASSSSSSLAVRFKPINPEDYVGLSISEVFPAPDPKRKDAIDPLLILEWIELRNDSGKILSLESWSLETASKSIRLGSGVSVQPASFFLLRSDEVGIKLRNVGDTVRLRSPDGALAFVFDYPEMKNGYSYASVDDDAFCVTTLPTPGEENQCASPAPVDRSLAAKKAAATRKNNTIAGYVGLYRADVAEAAGEGVVRLESERSSLGLGLVPLLFSLGFGLFGGMFGTWYATCRAKRELVK